jgi:DNA-binding NtrC family response regulator
MATAPNPPRPILIVDDEASILLAIDTTLQMAGLDHTITCQDSRQVIDIMAEKTVELMLLDLNMPNVDGHRLLDEVHRDHPEVPVIIVTGEVDIQIAVKCIQAGAFDYIVKPVEADRLITAVNRAVAFQELKRENRSLRRHLLRDDLEHPEAFGCIITANKHMLTLFQYVESIATTSQPVLVRGETGVGKELIARAIHRLSGLKGQFVAVNAAGLDDTVFSDTLFGHAKGAFTGADTPRGGLIEMASGGTLFLDEIGDLTPASQVKLLRLLQGGEYFSLGDDVPRLSNARIIAATNQRLSDLLQTGRFRKDLNYRLQTHRLVIPPLRERLDDIPLLTEHFMARAAASLEKAKPAVPEALLPLLSGYTYPGNVRELESMIFDAVSRHRSGVLSLASIKAHIRREQSSIGTTPSYRVEERDPPIRFSHRLPTIKEANRLLVAEAMRRSGGNQSRAAKMLGISQQALSKRLKKKTPPEHRQP